MSNIKAASPLFCGRDDLEGVAALININWFREYALAVEVHQDTGTKLDLARKKSIIKASYRHAHLLIGTIY